MPESPVRHPERSEGSPISTEIFHFAWVTNSPSVVRVFVLSRFRDKKIHERSTTSSVLLPSPACGRGAGGEGGRALSMFLVIHSRLPFRGRFPMNTQTHGKNLVFSPSELNSPSVLRVFILSRFRDKNVFVLLTPKIVKFFLTKSSDQRERIEVNRAVARIGWRPCRPLCRTHASHRWVPQLACPATFWHWCLMPSSAVSLFSSLPESMLLAQTLIRLTVPSASSPANRENRPDPSIPSPPTSHVPADQCV